MNLDIRISDVGGSHTARLLAGRYYWAVYVANKYWPVASGFTWSEKRARNRAERAARRYSEAPADIVYPYEAP